MLGLPHDGDAVQAEGSERNAQLRALWNVALRDDNSFISKSSLMSCLASPHD